MDVEQLSDERLRECQDAINIEANRRAMIAFFPGQLAGVVADARREAYVSDSRIREIFEDAMNADID